MGKSLGFEEDVVERGDQRDEEAKICRGRTRKTMFMLPGDQGIHELNFRSIVILYSEDDICI